MCKENSYNCKGNDALSSVPFIKSQMYDVYIGPLRPAVQNLSDCTGSTPQILWNNSYDEGYIEISLAAALPGCSCPS